MEKRNDEKEDSKEGDEVIENIEMNKNKEALITENWNLELGRPEERKEICMEQATCVIFFGIFLQLILILILCLKSLLCLKMTLDV